MPVVGHEPQEDGHQQEKEGNLDFLVELARSSSLLLFILDWDGHFFSSIFQRRMAKLTSKMSPTVKKRAV